MSLLADEVILVDLDEDSTSSTADRTQDAADGLCLLAQECLLDPVAMTRFLRFILKEPRALDLGLLIALAYLCSRNEKLHGNLRDQEFYPAILLDHTLADIAGLGRPSVRLLSIVVSSQAETAPKWAALQRAAMNVPRGFGKGLSWPDPASAEEIAKHLRNLRSHWEQVAAELLYAVRCESAPQGRAQLLRRLAGKLPGDTDFNALLDKLPPKLEALTAALRTALTWPQRASALFQCLAGEMGWLRLYFAYLCRITPSILRYAEHTPDAVVEIAQRELGWPCARLVPFLDDLDPSSFWKEPEFSDVERKRLQRMREACLDGPFEDPGEDFIALLKDIAALYDRTEALGRRR